MTKRVKLTKAQRLLLEEVSRYSRRVSSTYKPALKLVELGFAVMPRGGGSYPTLLITPAGRAYLAEDRADG